MKQNERRRTFQVLDDFTPRQRAIALSALWVWRSQLGRVGSGQPVPGLATAKAIREVEEIARLLGGDPNCDLFGVDPSHVT